MTGSGHGDRLNVLLAAEEGAGVRAMGAVHDAGHRVVAVLTSPTADGKGSGGVADAAERMGHPVWAAERVRNPAFADDVRAAGVDILLNVHSLFIIDGAVLSAPCVGGFNLHPGPLPQGAGLNAAGWAIYHGRRRHAVTLHWMIPEIDAGPIAYEAAVNIADTDTALSLGVKCARAGIPLIHKLLDAAGENPSTIPAVPQDRARRQYHGREAPQGGCLVWSRTAKQIVDFVRACDHSPYPSPWGHPRSSMDGVDCEIVKAQRTGQICKAEPGTIGDRDADGVLVAAADEWVRVRRVRRGTSLSDAAAVLRPGQRFATDTGYVLADHGRERKCAFVKELNQSITDLITSELNILVPSPDADLLQPGTLDSMALVELLMLLESRFDIEISWEDLEPDYFRSVRHIAGYVEKQRTAVASVT